VFTTAKVSVHFSSTTEDPSESLMLIYIPGGVELWIYNLTDNIGIYSENKKASDQVLERTSGGRESRPSLFPFGFHCFTTPYFKNFCTAYLR
jgi:hypothetical protein